MFDIPATRSRRRDLVALRINCMSVIRLGKTTSDGVWILGGADPSEQAKLVSPGGRSRP